MGMKKKKINDNDVDSTNDLIIISNQKYIINNLQKIIENQNII